MKIDIANKFVKLIFCYLLILLIPILGYVVNILTFDFYNSLGITPRTFSLDSISGIFLSWTMHGSFQHLKGNMILLTQLIIPFIFFERKPFRKILILSILSGIYVWVFGLPNSNHIGASGLIFALFGYMFASIIFKFNIFYLLFLIFAGGYFYSFIYGLIPQESVSFSAHFGGVVVGFVYGYFIHKESFLKFKSFVTFKLKFTD